MPRNLPPSQLALRECGEGKAASSELSAHSASTLSGLTRCLNKERREPFHPTAGRLHLAPNEAEVAKQRKTNRVRENQQGRQTRAGLSGRSEGSKLRGGFLRQILISPREDRTQCVFWTHTPGGEGSVRCIIRSN